MTLDLLLLQRLAIPKYLDYSLLPNAKLALLAHKLPGAFPSPSCIFMATMRGPSFATGLGRGCTLMQWFILFGLRASWTSSIIVIHRRKWAARGAARVPAEPPAPLSVARRHSRRQHARAAMHVAYAWRIQSWSVCVLRRARLCTGARASHVQCPSPSAARHSALCHAAPAARAHHSWRLSWSPPRLSPANARWVRSIAACSRYTSFDVSISSRSRNGSRWMDCVVSHYRLWLLKWWWFLGEIAPIDVRSVTVWWRLCW